MDKQIRVEVHNDYLHAFYLHDDKPIYFRDKTSDAAILKSVLLEQKEYIFPRFEPKVIFDIGGNVGIVAVLLANLYPSAKIYSFEPVKENFDILMMNSDFYPNIFPLNYGLSNETGDVKIYTSENEINHGGFSQHIKGEGEFQLVRMKDAAEACRDFGNPDLIKIDCEGAEYFILEAMPNLDKCQWIAGELHGILDFKLLALLDQHFKIKVQKELHDKIYHFHALSRSWKDFGRDPSRQ